MLIDLSIAALVNQFTNRLEVWLAVSNIGSYKLEHLLRSLGQAHKYPIVNLEQTQQLENLARLRGNFVDTLDTNNKRQLGLCRHVKVASGLGLAPKANFTALFGTVLTNVLVGAFEYDLTVLTGSL